MSRIAILSAGGDPFIASLVLKLWKDRWYNEIDKMFVCYNNHAGVPLEVSGEFLNKVVQDPKVHVIYHPRGIGNGMPITEAVLVSKPEDLIMLIEDDGYIFESGAVNKCFQLIESDLADVVGSPRFSCAAEIAEASKELYGLDYSGYGDMGPNWWPNFFFCKRSDLMKTDLDFSSKSWQPGEYCSELNHSFKELSHGDTAVWNNIQLRSLGVRATSVPQHHAGPNEITDKENGEQNWHPTQSWFPWIHGGSLSAGWSGYLSGTLPDLSNENAILEIETRVAFWTIASDVIDGFTEFKKEYKQGIENLVQKGNLNRERIAQKIAIYRELLKL